VGSVVSSFFNKLIEYRCAIHNHRIFSGIGIQVVFKLSLNSVACRGFELLLAKNNARTTDKWKMG